MPVAARGTSARGPQAARGLAGASLVLALALGCSGADPAEIGAAERGKAIYQNTCIACHHGDPAKDGSLGPAVAGASRELIEAKVLRGEYPPGYEAKRPGYTMPRYEYLAERIDDLAAYLAQAGG